MRVLITGGAGFIGSQLARRLHSQGHEIVILDNFITGSKGNVFDLLKYKDVTLIEQDVIRPIALDSVGQIYNLACPASPPHYQLDPVNTLKANVIGALNVLELAKRTGARVLQASTSEIYGDPMVHPQVESYHGNVSTTGIRACYDEGKRAAETLFSDYYRQYNVDTRIIRIFNTYGPGMRQDDGRVVSNFIVQALQNQNITIYGDGTQTRSFQFVDDLINGMIAMMEKDHFVDPVNLGNPNEFTVQQLAEIILKMIPESKSQIVHMPLPSDDPRKRQPDITLARRELDWYPRVELSKGLKPTIDYFKQILAVS